MPKRIMIIAPNYQQARMFAHYTLDLDLNSEFYVVLHPEHLLGARLEEYEVWWLDRMWPCSTHEDVEYMEYMKALAKARGADLHRWWT